MLEQKRAEPWRGSTLLTCIAPLRLRLTLQIAREDLFDHALDICKEESVGRLTYGNLGSMAKCGSDFVPAINGRTRRHHYRLTSALWHCAMSSPAADGEQDDALIPELEWRGERGIGRGKSGEYQIVRRHQTEAESESERQVAK